MAGLARRRLCAEPSSSGAIGLIVAAALLWFVSWGVAVVTGWDVPALAFLVSVWPIIIRADGPRAAQPAKRTHPFQSCLRSRVRQRLFRWPSRV